MSKISKKWYNPRIMTEKIMKPLTTIFKSSGQSYNRVEPDRTNLIENYLPKKLPILNELLVNDYPTGGVVNIDIPRTINHPVLKFTIKGYRNISTNKDVLDGESVELRHHEVYYHAYEVLAYNFWEHIMLEVDQTHSNFIRLILKSNTIFYLTNLEVYENIFDSSKSFDEIEWDNQPTFPPVVITRPEWDVFTDSQQNQF